VLGRRHAAVLLRGCVERRGVGLQRARLPDGDGVVGSAHRGRSSAHHDGALRGAGALQRIRRALRLRYRL
jgi:hypothetical protein